MSDTKTGLDLLRVPFPPHLISQRPADRAGKVMLSYVGHAALTDRLLDADPAWTWEPLAMSPEGWPVVDPLGGMWIKLTVCGVTRLGYGDAQGKEGPNAIKECIGDALRNAAMRFGAALDLWHKGDLHAEEPAKPQVAHSGPALAFASLSPDWQAWLREFSVEVENVFAEQGPEAAKALIDDKKVSAEMQAEHIAGLWSLLGSKTRSSIKALR